MCMLVWSFAARIRDKYLNHILATAHNDPGLGLAIQDPLVLETFLKNVHGYIYIYFLLSCGPFGLRISVI